MEHQLQPVSPLGEVKLATTMYDRLLWRGMALDGGAPPILDEIEKLHAARFPLAAIPC